MPIPNTVPVSAELNLVAKSGHEVKITKLLLVVVVDEQDPNSLLLCAVLYGTVQANWEERRGGGVEGEIWISPFQDYMQRRRGLGEKQAWIGSYYCSRAGDRDARSTCKVEPV